MKERRKIEKQSIRSLRKLRKNLTKSLGMAIDYRQKVQTKLWEAEASIKNLYRLEGRVDYWLGKKKGLNCPAFRKNGETLLSDCSCPARMDWSSSSKYLFSSYCSNCTLTRTEALKQATLRRVFSNAK